MTSIRALLVDDEPLARAGLRALLSEEPGVTVIGESTSGAAAASDIQRLLPDVVFLDIGLPDLDGFGVVESLHVARPPLVVFVTAHPDQALRAFDIRAVDYVTKPLRRERVREAVARVRERLALPARSGEAPLTLKSAGGLRLVDQRSIDFVQADDDHVVVHLGAQSLRVRERLRDVERRLDSESFIRIHRSTVVRLSAILRLEPWFHGDVVVVLRSGAKVRLSRNFRDRVARALGRESL